MADIISFSFDYFIKQKFLSHFTCWCNGCVLEMAILIKLYGKLRDNVKGVDLEKGLPVTLNIEEPNVHFISDIVEKLAISEDELSHIFVNGKYCGIGKEVRDGDRVGLFPKNMALMFAEIPLEWIRFNECEWD